MKVSEYLRKLGKVSFRMFYVGPRFAIDLAVVAAMFICLDHIGSMTVATAYGVYVMLALAAGAVYSLYHYWDTEYGMPAIDDQTLCLWITTLIKRTGYIERGIYHVGGNTFDLGKIRKSSTALHGGYWYRLGAWFIDIPVRLMGLNICMILMITARERSDDDMMAITVCTTLVASVLIALASRTLLIAASSEMLDSLFNYIKLKEHNECLDLLSARSATRSDSTPVK